MQALDVTGRDGRPGPGNGGPPRPRKRRALRIAVIATASVVALAALAVGGGLLALNHLASSIRRVPVAFAKLSVLQRPASPAGGGMTVLITGAGIGPTGSSTKAPDTSGLIMLLHINVNQQGGGVVSIPPQALVPVPGHGDLQLQDALAHGGPSMLVRTVENLTHDPIQHYARIDFSHVANVVDAVGGVNVVLPAGAASFGHQFHAGLNHLTGVQALAYARQPSLTEEGRVLRQQSLMRAVMSKIANDRLLLNPVTAYHVLSALASMLTVDSNFTNSEIAHLASQLRGLNSGDGTFVTAPVHTAGSRVRLDSPVSHQLWQAIGQGSLAAFARQHRVTVTPQTVP
jgi:LCP family protein required for cell wall assembly